MLSQLPLPPQKKNCLIGFVRDGVFLFNKLNDHNRRNKDEVFGRCKCNELANKVSILFFIP